MATATSHPMMGGLPSLLLQKPIERPRRLEIAYVERRRTVSVAKIEAVDSPSQPTLSLLEVEGEDAKLTGGTRSLTRRLLALNLHGTLRRTVTRSLPQASKVSVLRSA